MPVGFVSDVSDSKAAPLLGRTQSEIQGTPLRGGVFVLANTILGAGMLGLPFAFAACGFIIGPMMLAGFAICSIVALTMLSECADAVGRPATFNTVAEKAVPGSGLAISAAVAIKCFGVATSYLIVIGDSVPKSVIALGGSGILVKRQVWTLAALCVAAPLAYMKRITALRNVSLVALGCVLCLLSGGIEPPRPVPHCGSVAVLELGSTKGVPAARRLAVLGSHHRHGYLLRTSHVPT